MKDNFRARKLMVVGENEDIEDYKHDNQETGCSDSRYDILMDVDNHGFHHKAKVRNL